MNPKIKELAEQSGSTHKPSLGVYQFYTDELEKFAELIIRECYKIAMKEGNGFYCPSDILDNFGIEK